MERGNTRAPSSFTDEVEAVKTISTKKALDEINILYHISELFRKPREAKV